ncbi:tRNA (adenosine(37)-N6)-threonylcarbamoyltransferase complex dimerization subunit type 1 TsaB [Parasediminibacterium paludis]|uniref:tRNA (Adenosine(37)-N6)-threonylcarbamoyltransferase complex dimerization subunit type 1 TsaB n=1 Tax=Parasediminibacterium paludis TaxID=908966 RepID=A0ABV8Q0Q4_9BACT
MALLLHIDTATEHASVCLSNNRQIISYAENADPKNHGSFLQPAIQQLFQNTAYQLSDIDAISVSNGPGSYTGLRVGLASAKGLCFALNKPLITLNTLQIMAEASVTHMQATAFDTNYLFCPLIDARRMEVFTAIYDAQLTIVLQPMASIINETSFQEVLVTNKIVFTGSGHHKLQTMLQHPNAYYYNIQHNAKNMVSLALESIKQNTTANLTYIEPFYIKAFFDGKKA